MPRVTAHGKQIKLDGEHLADAVSNDAAEAIATALNWSGLPVKDWTPEAQEIMIMFFA